MQRSAARAERKTALQGSGLVRTVGPCAQRRVVPHDKAQDWSELKGRVHKEVNASGHRTS